MTTVIAILMIIILSIQAFRIGRLSWKVDEIMNVNSYRSEYLQGDFPDIDNRYRALANRIIRFSANPELDLADELAHIAAAGYEQNSGKKYTKILLEGYIEYLVRKIPDEDYDSSLKPSLEFMLRLAGDYLTIQEKRSLTKRFDNTYQYYICLNEGQLG